MLYGIYGSHTPETCPIYVAKYARVFVEIAGLDPEELAETYGIRRIEARYHSALEHTFLWIVEADRPHDIERFAVDTGLFEPRDILLDFVETRTREDGMDLGPLLMRLFQVLNTPEDARPATLDEDLAGFPYVNGELFADPISIPDFNAEMREQLLTACRFNWSSISPAIFGSLFQ